MYCKLINKEYANERDMFLDVKQNKASILKAMKSEVKTKRLKLLGFASMDENQIKALPNTESEKIYPVISTTNYYDSHGDVHMDGSMTKTANEQNGKIFYTSGHKLDIENIIALPKDVKISIRDFDYSEISKFSGSGQALIFEIDRSKIIHDKFLKMLDNDAELQNSIRMQYIKAEIGFNSDDEDFTEEKRVYDEVFNKVANKDKLAQQKIVTAVRELKIVMEGSAVLFGSNDMTPIKREVAQSTSDKSQESTINWDEYIKKMFNN